MDNPEPLLSDIAAYLGEIVGAFERAQDAADCDPWVKIGSYQSTRFVNNAKMLIDRIFPDVPTTG